MKLVLTGGGTGGHSICAIGFYERLKGSYQKKDSIFKCIYIGSKTGIEKEIAQKESLAYFPISTGKWRTYASFQNISDLFRIAKGVLEAYRILKKFRPHLILGTGGFVQIPVLLAGAVLRIPIAIHEQTSRAGLANRLGGRLARHIGIAFESSSGFFPKEKTVLCPSPLRKAFFSLSPDFQKKSNTKNTESAYKRWNFDPNLPLLYITGGSQGSHSINQNIKKVLRELLSKMNILHQCGKGHLHQDFQELRKEKETLVAPLKQRYWAVDFLDSSEQKDLYQSVDLIISRAGAGTVQEILALAMPSILIPLPEARKNEQYHNAQFLENLGGACIVLEKPTKEQKTPEDMSLVLKEKIISYIENPELLTKMRKNLKSLRASEDEFLSLLFQYTEFNMPKKF